MKSNQIIIVHNYDRSIKFASKTMSAVTKATGFKPRSYKKNIIFPVTYNGFFIDVYELNAKISKDELRNY